MLTNKQVPGLHPGDETSHDEMILECRLYGEEERIARSKLQAAFIESQRKVLELFASKALLILENSDAIKYPTLSCLEVRGLAEVAYEAIQGMLEMVTTAKAKIVASPECKT